MKKNEQTRDVRDLVSLASDSNSLASFICKFARLGHLRGVLRAPRLVY